ncbi:amidohydrolase [Pedobacter sp. Hv1]|uniref:amidohydrolase family protein n=1 Tax=Pedobacter sp. Hv1 TaxID=1740090 RepID=UPI000B042BAF|nr:amidohydrolase family protein [Pedobacter sp. Hv1]
MIDSHQHFWQHHPVKDSWISDEMAVIKRDFLPVDLVPILKDNGINGCIAVQADQSEVETNFLLDLAKQNPFIKGVVGWVNLQNANINERLHYFSQFKQLKGWRHILQAEPDGLMLKPEFLRGIKALTEFGYTYDILIHQHQLPEVIQLVDKCQNQAFVIDHCAKPAIKNNEIADWKSHIQSIAQHPNVYCKLSGLLTEADWKHWDEKQIFNYLDVVFESFGTERLMFGSDWPVLLLAGSYSQWKGLIQRYVQQLSQQEQQQIFNDNAYTFYKL